jgi:alpha-L-arabinofuranosidase
MQLIGADMEKRKVFGKRGLWLAVAMLCAAALFGIVLFRDPQVTLGQTDNILQNASFEQENRGVPSGWTLEQKAAPKGRVSLSGNNAHSGQFSLKLEPNRKNTNWNLEQNPLGVGQGIATRQFRGNKLYLSGWMTAEGNATAIVAAVALGGKTPGVALLKQSSGQSSPVFHEDILMVPDDANILVVVCSVDGTSGAAYFDDVRLGPTALEGERSATPPPPPQERGRRASARPGAEPDSSSLRAQVTVSADQDVRKIPITLYGMNIEWIWNANGIWNANLKRLDPDLIKLTRELKPSLLRFPGGIFSDFYHWRDGIGPQDRRPTTPHIMDSGDSSVHSFGTDEALAFADQTGSQLLITVNVGTGTAQEAADWVRYVNQRNRRVVYWEIGNELYVKGGHPGFVKTTMAPDKYARKFLEFARAMKSADPGIKIGAIGDENYGDMAPRSYGDWTSQVLRTAGQEMDFLAIHNAYAPQVIQDKGWPFRQVYAALLAAPIEIRRSIDTAARKVDELGGSRRAQMKLAVTEWGPYFQIDPSGHYVDHVKTLGSALYVASTLKVFLESPKTDVATGFKLSDELFQGWIGKRRGQWIPKAPYYALQMYTNHFGSVLVNSSTEAPTYNSRTVGLVDAQNSVPYLDIVASRSEDGRKLYVIGINKHFDSPIRASITLQGRRAAGDGIAWTLNGPSIDANTGTELFQAPKVKWASQVKDDVNSHFDSGSPDQVRITSNSLSVSGTAFEYEFPAHSVTSLEIPIR